MSNITEQLLADAWQNPSTSYLLHRHRANELEIENTGELTENRVCPIDETSAENASTGRQYWETVQGIIEPVEREYAGMFGYLKSKAQTSLNIGELLAYFMYRGDVLKPRETIEPKEKMRKDTQTYFWDAVPVSCLHGEFDVGMRLDAGMKKNGLDLKAQMIEDITEEIMISLNEMLATGGMEFMGKEIYGMTNHPNRITYNIDESAWNLTKDDSALAAGQKNERVIVRQAIAMVSLLEEKNLIKPGDEVCIGLPKNVFSKWKNDYNPEYPSKTLMERVEDLMDSGADGSDKSKKAVKRFYQLPDNNVVVFVAKKKFIEIKVAAETGPAVLDSNDYGSQHGVYTIQVPCIKPIIDVEGTGAKPLVTAIVHGS